MPPSSGAGLSDGASSLIAIYLANSHAHARSERNAPLFKIPECGSLADTDELRDTRQRYAGHQMQGHDLHRTRQFLRNVLHRRKQGFPIDERPKRRLGTSKVSINWDGRRIT